MRRPVKPKFSEIVLFVVCTLLGSLIALGVWAAGEPIWLAILFGAECEILFFLIWWKRQPLWLLLQKFLLRVWKLLKKAPKIIGVTLSILGAVVGGCFVALATGLWETGVLAGLVVLTLGSMLSVVPFPKLTFKKKSKRVAKKHSHPSNNHHH